MRVIVSTEVDDNFSNYKVVRSFSDLNEFNKIDCIIIHKYDESDFDAGLRISELYKKGVSRFIYACSTPSLSTKMAIIGVDGDYVQDEFYFEDEAELDGLLEMLGVSGNEELAVSDSSIAVISDFIKAFMRKEERVNTPIYLESVQNALASLQSTNTQLATEKKDMGLTAVGIFEQARGIIDSMDSQHKLLTRQLNELQDTMKEDTSSPRSMFGGGGVNYFPSVSYTGRTKVLLIREYSPCRYLTSFILAYHHHLQYDVRKNAKVIFVHQKGQGVLLRYSDFANITQESLNNTDLFTRDKVSTNTPKKEVIRGLLQQGDDIAIVVDRLYGAQDIVTGRVKKVCAVGGFSDLKRYNLKPENTIFPVSTHPNGLITLPTIKNFPFDVDSRIASYHKSCSQSYKILDKILEVGV